MLNRRGWPSRKQFKSLVVVALGVAFGFPVLSALAMREVHASHAGIMLGVLPLATAAAGAAFSGERPSAGFWAMALLGSLLLGSLPGIWLGTHVSAKVPEHILRRLLASMLILIGSRLVFA